MRGTSGSLQNPKIGIDKQRNTCISSQFTNINILSTGVDKPVYKSTVKWHLRHLQ